MHGRKKSATPQSEEEKNAITAKVAAYRKLSDKLLEARQAMHGDDKALVAKAQLAQSVLELQGQLLKVNPDFSTLWNHRKELLLAQIFSESGTVAGGEPVASPSPSKGSKGAFLGAVAKPPCPLPPALLKSELALTASCIQKQPKSYAAWHHRLWIIKGHAERSANPTTTAATAGTAAAASPQQGGQDEETASLLQAELALCAQLLDLDQRNFHCWAYRLQIARYSKASVEFELAYTLEKITQNFSNYSAFHYRSKVIERWWTAEQSQEGGSTKADSGAGVEPEATTPATSEGDSGTAGEGGAEAGAAGAAVAAAEMFRSELEMVGQAAYTEPSDQSAWWYHRFLLEWGLAASSSSSSSLPKQEEGGAAADSGGGGATEAREIYASCLRAEAENLRSLVEMEPGCKWPVLALASVLSYLVRCHRGPGGGSGGTGGKEEDGEEGEVSALSKEWTAAVETLKQVDPTRCVYYSSLCL